MKPTTLLHCLGCFALVASVGASEALACYGEGTISSGETDDMSNPNDSFETVDCDLAGREAGTLVVEEHPVYVFRLRARFNGSQQRPIGGTAFAFRDDGSEIEECHIWPERGPYPYPSLNLSDFCLEEPASVTIYGYY